MIESKEAVDIIIRNTWELSHEKLDLEQAFGRVIAQDVISVIDLPPFDQSAMDGYAVSSIDRTEFEVIGEHRAGDRGIYTLAENEALRIFTGAVVPKGAMAVIRQEDITRNEKSIVATDKSRVKGENIRFKGEQIRSGEVAVKAGKVLNPGTVGYLASLGVKEVCVSSLPKVSIITTGDELVPPGQSLEPGQIFESNSMMLRSVLHREGIWASVLTVPDNRDMTINALREAISESDIVLITGGISVGSYDFVYDALHSLSVKDLFHKIAQKPGKPMYAGKLDQTLICGLPGNPAAALTCFYLYVIPAIRKMQGREQKELTRVKLAITTDYHKSGTFSHHLKGYANGKTVGILPRQSSAMLGDYTDANCIIILGGDKNEWKKGEEVDVLLLPA